MKTIVKVFKLVGGLMISIGVGALVKNVLLMITPPGAKAVIRICMAVGGYFLGGLAAKAASDAFEDRVDKTLVAIDKVSNVVNVKIEYEKETIIEMET